VKLKLNTGIQDVFYSCAIVFSTSHCIWRTIVLVVVFGNKYVYYWSVSMKKVYDISKFGAYFVCNFLNMSIFIKTDNN